MHLLVAGRAERLGLAISLVSRVPEKVWYCKQKGYKPWLKPKERDTRTHEEGGHTIWYNEQELLKVSPACSLQLGRSGSPTDQAEARAQLCEKTRRRRPHHLMHEQDLVEVTSECKRTGITSLVIELQTAWTNFKHL